MHVEEGVLEHVPQITRKVQLPRRMHIPTLHVDLDVANG
jgi:hypothetical protein